MENKKKVPLLEDIRFGSVREEIHQLKRDVDDLSRELQIAYNEDIISEAMCAQCRKELHKWNHWQSQEWEGGHRVWQNAVSKCPDAKTETVKKHNDRLEKEVPAQRTAFLRFRNHFRANELTAYFQSNQRGSRKLTLKRQREVKEF